MKVIWEILMLVWQIQELQSEILGELYALKAQFLHDTAQIGVKASSSLLRRDSKNRIWGMHLVRGALIRQRNFLKKTRGWSTGSRSCRMEFWSWWTATKPYVLYLMWEQYGSILKSLGHRTNGRRNIPFEVQVQHYEGPHCLSLCWF